MFLNYDAYLNLSIQASIIHLESGGRGMERCLLLVFFCLIVWGFFCNFILNSEGESL